MFRLHMTQETLTAKEAPFTSSTYIKLRESLRVGTEIPELLDKF